MATPVIPGIGPTDRVGSETAKLRSELQQLGTSLRSGPTPAVSLDLVEVRPVQATPQGLLYESFRALGQALQSGNLKTVQAAYRALAKAMQTTSLGPGSQPPPGAVLAVLADATRALRQAVHSGDLAGAQQAYATIRQSLQNARTSAQVPLADERTDGESDRANTPRSDRPSSAQQAYWLVQQEALDSAHVSPANTFIRRSESETDTYSLYLLLAADRLPTQLAHEERPESNSSRTPSRSRSLLWWAALNLAAIVCLALTGLIQSPLASAIPVFIALGVLNILIFLALRFS